MAATPSESEMWELYGFCDACVSGDGEFEHVCTRTPEERGVASAHHAETVEIMLTRGAGRHRRADGTWMTVLRGRGDPEWPAGDGFDAEG